MTDWTPMSTPPETTGFYMIRLDSDVDRPEQRWESIAGHHYPIAWEVAFFDTGALNRGLSEWTTLRHHSLPESWRAIGWRPLPGGDGADSRDRLKGIEEAILSLGPMLQRVTSCAYDPPDPRLSIHEIERSLWRPMYQPPVETGWYLIRLSADTDRCFGQITDRFFNAEQAAIDRGNPELASADPQFFGWEDAILATHWRRLPEGPDE